ncbi:adenosine deaminase [bacterium]|nr:adenosine deaminase [bacterium]
MLEKPGRDLLYAIPKTDLHVHLDGSLRISTVRELAAKHKLPFNFKTDDDVRAVCQVDERCESLEDYLKVFDITLQLMQTKEELERIAFELAEDAHHENIRYMEVRYSPMLHTIKGLKLDEIVEAVQKGLDRARRQFGIFTGQIVCGIRHISVESSLELADLAVRWKNRGVVAFDLAGAEKDFPAKDHIQAFYKVLNANMPVTVHAGEAFGAESIHQAVHYCGANRIGHGTHLSEDMDLLQWVNDRRIAVEVCLASNLQTGAILDYASHPIKKFMEEGLRVTLNTDNRLVSGTTMTNELVLAVEHYNLTTDQIAKILLDGFKSSFLPLVEKASLINRVLDEFYKLGVNYSGVISRRWRAFH